MTLTEQILNQGMSARGGWSAKQLRQIVPASEYKGNAAFPVSGWRRRIIGLEVQKEQIEQFLRLRKKDTQEKTGNLFDQKCRPDYTLDTVLLPEDGQHMQSIRCEILAS